MKKALLVSTVSRQFTLFDSNNIKILQELGYEVHCAANFEDVTPAIDKLGIKRHHIDIQRSPFSIKNVKAFFQLLAIMKTEEYNLIHCHAPMGGVIGRISAALTRQENVYYTAHGFHFYKGAPILNWILFYPMEKLCSYLTDCLLTINEEDYMFAKKHLKARKIIHIPGIGIDTEKIWNVVLNRNDKLRELGIPDNARVILSVGELNKNKNHETLIKAISRIDTRCFYIICGKGNLLDYLKGIAEKYRVSDRVIFLGFRNDIFEILKISHLFVMPSYREGLPVSLMEAMAAGLPVVCSKIRGCVDLIKDGKGGYLIEPDNVDGFAKNIEKILGDDKLGSSMSLENIENVKRFDVVKVNKMMTKLYENGKGAAE